MEETMLRSGYLYLSLVLVALIAAVLLTQVLAFFRLAVKIQG